MTGNPVLTYTTNVVFRSRDLESIQDIKSAYRYIFVDGEVGGKSMRFMIDTGAHSSIIHDDRTLLAIRVAQYSHPRAHARLPVTRTCHQIGNVLVLEKTDALIRVASTLTLVEYRQERQRVWGALVEHRLRRTPTGWQIAAKRIDLVNAQAELDGISILF
jgi:hypothetical protein